MGALTDIATIARWEVKRTLTQMSRDTLPLAIVLFVLALPANPFNLLTRLAVGTAGMEQWIVLAGVIAIGAILSIATQQYAEKIVQQHHTG